MSKITHWHDDGKCCECGGPHCCCDCPSFGGAGKQKPTGEPDLSALAEALGLFPKLK